MINVTIGNTTSRKNVIIDENTTLRAALEQNGVDYAIGQTSLDGATLNPGELNKTFAEMGVDGTPGKDKCYLMVVVKADNAAAITIAGGAVVVESAAKLADVKKLAKYRPNALKLTEGHGAEKRDVFAVSAAASGSGSINQYGVSFGTQTTEAGNATVTLVLPDTVTDPKKWAMDVIGAAILKLQKVEDQFAAANDEIDTEIAAIEGTMTVM